MQWLKLSTPSDNPRHFSHMRWSGRGNPAPANVVPRFSPANKGGVSHQIGDLAAAGPESCRPMGP